MTYIVGVRDCNGSYNSWLHAGVPWENTPSVTCSQKLKIWVLDIFGRNSMYK